MLLLVIWLLSPWLLESGEVSCQPLEPAGTDLVVLLHAFNSSSSDLEPMRRVVEEVLGGPDVLACDLPFDTLSMARPEEVVHGLVSQIDRAWERKKETDRVDYEKVIFVGHSMGALFARKAYVVASGETEDAPFGVELKTLFEPELRARLEPELQALADPEFKALLEANDPRLLLPARSWAGGVDRIVLMAGMNRGWSISHHMSIIRAATMSAGVVLGRVLEKRFGRLPLIFSVRRGAPFITNLRIQWIEMRRRAREKGTPGGAKTVQLLGSKDDLVSPEDNIDLVSGRHFFYLDVPLSGHADVIDMRSAAQAPPPTASREDRARYQRGRTLDFALTADRDDLAAVAVELGEEYPLCRPEADAPAAASRPKPDETHVLFVIHGIRDEGYWTQKIARRVRARARGTDKNVVPETSTYGYFPMLPFLRTRARLAKVEWLMDRYTEARACYPEAKFHYVGHSNGTYLLAKALERYPSCRFNRVVFAGSVVRTDYEWSKAKERGQVDEVLNFVASGDWVVAFFPKALEIIGWQDLGSAGHDGFVEGVFEPRAPDGGERYVKGGHGAALDEALWGSIAEFVIDEEIPADFATRLTSDEELKGAFIADRGRVVSLLGAVAPLVWIVIAIVLTAILYGLLKLPMREWKRTVIVLGYLALLWMIVTRV